MLPGSRQILHWLPRVLALVGIMVLGLFAVDVFVVSGTVNQIAPTLVIDLLFLCLVIVATGIAWRWPLLGGVLFIALGYCTILIITDQRIILISLPPMLVGLLFLWEGTMGWLYEDERNLGAG